MQVAMVSFEELCNDIRSKSPNPNIDLVKKAHEFASHIHARQLTPSGRERIMHLLNTAKIISKLSPDEETLAAAILHDSIIYGGVQREELSKLFGKEIANLVEEYTKEFKIEEANLDKLDFGILSTVVLASAKDIRSIFINICTMIDFFSWREYIDKRFSEKKARLALNTYAPICHKLGLNEFEWMLEDFAFTQLYRNEYTTIKELVNEKREQREKCIERAKTKITSLMNGNNLNVFVQGRAKHFYSIYKKMKNEPFTEIYDLLGVRIICDSEEDCYKALGIINSNFQIIEHKFRDYIADPKENKYKSIHAVILFEGRPIEVQIRTWQMHWDNEVGLAAHWQYKHLRQDRFFDKKLSIINQLIEWHKTQLNSKELVQSLKTSSGEERIFVFTPKREVVILRDNSSPIDFAFAIHSDIGYRAKGAKVNGNIVPLDYMLENGDMVEILTSSNIQVKRAWLSFVKTEKAKTKIKQALGMKDPISVKKQKRRAIEKTTSDMGIRIANCCKPVPGDEIIGYRTTKRKITVHRRGCGNLGKMDAKRVVPIAWAGGVQKNYVAELKVTARENAALIPEILRVFSENDIKIHATHAKSDNGITRCLFSVSIAGGKEQLEKAMGKVAALPYVLGIERA